MKTINSIFEKCIDLTIFAPYRIHCEKCCGLCCVALYCAKSDGFPKNKESGVACEKLLIDYKCKIHSKLSQQALKGCFSYDCFGAGQFISSHLKVLPNWSTFPSEEAAKIFSSYLVVLRVHQTLWYLSQCLILRLPRSEKEQAKYLLNEGNILLEKPFERLVNLNIPFCKKSNEYLKHICKIYQTGFGRTANMQVKNYMGKNMKQKNLAGRDFSMSLLIAANLEHTNLYGANFLGADMRDVNICSTDLSQSLFLTQIQINTAKGNINTILPPFLHKPEGWGT